MNRIKDNFAAFQYTNIICLHIIICVLFKSATQPKQSIPGDRRKQVQYDYRK